METDIDRRARFERAARTVYEPLQRYLGRRAPADDVSELLNDALLVMWRRLDDVPVDDPLPWAYGVARRCLANHRRGDARRRRLTARLAARPAPPGRFDGHDGSGAEGEDLRVALDGLDEAERELVRLWAWEQLEPREIALVLDTTANAVSLRLSRVKRKIGAALDRQNGVAAGHKGLGHGRETGS